MFKSNGPTVLDAMVPWSMAKEKKAKKKVYVAGAVTIPDLE